MTPHDLAAWAEQALPQEQRAVLDAAWRSFYGTSPAVVIYDCGTFGTRPGHSDREVAERFFAMLDAEAYESAALMLLPEGWEVSMYFAMTSFRPEVQLENETTRAKWDDPITGNASTPALALIAACARAVG